MRAKISRSDKGKKFTGHHKRLLRRWERRTRKQMLTQDAPAKAQRQYFDYTT